MDTSVLNAFMTEIQQIMKVIKQATQTEHVNLVILSNTISHIHAYLIPRFPQNEANPQLSPWDDPRPKTLMLDDKKGL